MQAVIVFARYWDKDEVHMIQHVMPLSKVFVIKCGAELFNLCEFQLNLIGLTWSHVGMFCGKSVTFM